jgi:hypothetical protein
MLGVAASRPALVSMSSNTVRVEDEHWDDDMALPVVDPANILTTESTEGKGGIPFTIDQMMAMGEMRMTNDSWMKIIMSLGDREGTVLDITADMLAYENQEALAAVRRTGHPLDVKTHHVFAALTGQSTWPTTLSVESWLRDAVINAGRPREQKAALMLWGIVVAKAVGEEAIRNVVVQTSTWYNFVEEKHTCSKGGSEGVAVVVSASAKLYKEFLWLKIVEEIEDASAQSFWDWRRVDYGCFEHGCGKCPNAGQPRMHYEMRTGCEFSDVDE